MTPRTAPLLLALTLLAGCSSTHKAATPSVPTASASSSPSASPAASPTPSPSALPSAPPSAAVTPSAKESPAPLGQPTCRAAAVTVTDADQLGTDQATQELFVLRTDGRPCQLQGWPSVRLLDSAGRPMAVQVQHGGYGLSPTPPAAVTLSQGTSLSFFVATARSGRCVNAGTLLVTLPGTSTALRTPTSMSVCGAAVGVSPIHRLADDESASG